MGKWSVLDQISWYRGVEAESLARRNLKPPALPADTPWYKRYVGNGTQTRWWHILVFLGVFAIVCVVNFSFEPITLPWWDAAWEKLSAPEWMWRFVIAGFWFWCAYRVRVTVRERARARRARLGPFEDVVKRGRTAEIAIRVMAERREAALKQPSRPIWVWLSGRRSMLFAGAAVIMLAQAIEDLVAGPKNNMSLSIGALVALIVILVLIATSRVNKVDLSKRTCPDCDYDLHATEPDAKLEAAGVDAGPARCPECGTRLPLVPAASGREVLWWDRRTRGLV
ncbi:MAG TPA: hypothetical protein VK157_06890 [Phycisphaerales bacterium]|nr:hypothetical protein [Phycisphaerales bacterium]